MLKVIIFTTTGCKRCIQSTESIVKLLDGEHAGFTVVNHEDFEHRGCPFVVIEREGQFYQHFGRLENLNENTILHNNVLLRITPEEVYGVRRY